MATQPEDAETTEIVGEGVAPALREREPAPTALMPFTAGGALEAMIPRTPEEYSKLASLIMNAGCVPASYEEKTGTDEQRFKGTRAKLIIGLMKSVEIGVPPLTGLNGIMIVNNRPSVWGDLAISLIQRDGHLAKMEVREVGTKPDHDMDNAQWDRSYGYKVMMWRRGQELPYVGEFTVSDARRASLWNNTKKQPWILYPKWMLFNRARSFACRAGFADSLHGMAIVEEIRDTIVEAPRVTDTSFLSDEPAPEPDTVQPEGEA